MLTVVMLLLLPAVLCLSIFRLVQLPRDLLAGRRRLHRRSAALMLGIIWIALALYTGLVLFTAARAIASPPATMRALFSLASVAAAYPFVYLAFEWISYYLIAPVEPA
jgi:hypothetical protein